MANEKHHSLLANRIPLIYAMGYSFSKYLTEVCNQKSVCVYCEQADYDYAQQICFDLSLSFDIDVKFWLSNEAFSANFPNQNLTWHPNFNPAFLYKPNEGDTILVLTSDCNMQYPNKLLHSKYSKIVYLLDIWGDVWWNGLVVPYLKKLRRKYPFLPVIISTDPHFPRKAEFYSSEEKWIADNNIGHYLNIIWPSLHKDGAVIPKTFEKFGYSVNELIQMLDGSRTVIEGKLLKLRNFESRYVNIESEHRRTTAQPREYKKTIYIFGGCIAYGTGCPDCGTSSSQLQSILSCLGKYDYIVENYGAYVGQREKYLLETVLSKNYVPGDIVYISLASGNVPGNVQTLPEGCFYHNVDNIFERPHSWGESIFFDDAHLNEIGQKVIAEKMAEFLFEHNYFSEISKTTNCEELADGWKAELNAWQQTLIEHKPKIGAIVVNCNPFTLGHRHLVEYAALKSEKLFVFVVEEDKSFFPFADRIELVRKGVWDLKNVTILPSGKFIISNITFGDYFGKDAKQEDTTVDPSLDVELFATQIAPVLGITTRFAGEEPLDKVTLKYNQAMSRILPQHGIKFEVIRRKESDGAVISASRVRALLKENNFEEIKKIVPQTTFSYLLDKHGNRGGGGNILHF